MATTQASIPWLDSLDEAARLFDQVAASPPNDDMGAEALYWAAVARYKGSGQADDLMNGWAKLRGRYPDSVWRTRQSFTEQQ